MKEQGPKEEMFNLSTDIAALHNILNVNREKLSLEDQELLQNKLTDSLKRMEELICQQKTQ